VFDGKTFQTTCRLFPRHTEGHLLRRKEGPRRIAKDGEGRRPWPKAGPILPDVPTLGVEAPCVARDLQSLDRDARPAILWRIKAAEMMAYT